MALGDYSDNHGVPISDGSPGTPIFWVENATDLTQIEVAFSLMNIGHGDKNQVIDELRKFLGSSASNIFGVADTVTVDDGKGHSSGGDAGPFILPILAAITLVPLFKGIFDDCDGPVAWGKTTYTGQQLSQLINKGNGKYVQTISTTGHGCEDFEYRSDIYFAQS